MLKGRHSLPAGSGKKSSKVGKPPKPPRTPFSIISLFASDRNRKKSKSSLTTSHVYADAEGGNGGTSSAFTEPGLSVVTYDDPRPDTVVCSEASKGKLKECPLCFEEQPQENFCSLTTCSHKSCLSCLRQYLKIEIAESRVSISCPECSELLHPSDIKRLLNNSAQMDKWEKFMLRRILASDPDTRWCPAPDCGYAVIATGCAGCPKLQCQRPGCDTFFCYHCKQEWHPSQTCDAARLQRTSNLRAIIATFSVDALTPEPREDIKLCPRCKSYITKLDDGSCNHMTCTLCGAQFCWLCNKEITDLHYLSPSGCTFWGKKPWSRKKKILWQLGTLLGAPVGIALLACLAVPVIVVAFPVYAGKWLYQRHKNKSKAKRNAIVVAGVTGALLLSPLVAALAVAIGVPVMLTYVYGVVPVSLCRGASGGQQQAAPATSSVSVRFDFDDDVAAESAHASVANPSIAPSIGEASWAANSYSASITHIDHAGCVRDGGPIVSTDEQSDAESASQKAIAGPSLNGSLYDTESAAGQNRLEIHADIAPRHAHRSSLSSESVSASVSMADNKSVALSTATGDSISVKALAGSFVALREKDGHIVFSANAPTDQFTTVNEEAKAKLADQTVVSADGFKLKGRSLSHGSPVSNRSVTFAPGPDEHLMGRHPSIKVGRRREKNAGDRPPSDRSIVYQNAPGALPQYSFVPADGEFSPSSVVPGLPKGEHHAGVVSGDNCSVVNLSGKPHWDNSCCGGTCVAEADVSEPSRQTPEGCQDVPSESGHCSAVLHVETPEAGWRNSCDGSYRQFVDLRDAKTNAVGYTNAAVGVIRAMSCVGSDLHTESGRFRRRMSCELAMENGLRVDIV